MADGHAERLDAALGGRYRIERKLGEGGMASVYLAEDLKHRRKVALKVLKPELAAVIGADRFLTEIQTTANLQHPHILALFDSGEADGYLYYVMPYVEGETLREKLDREKQLGVEESVRIARDVADALDYAHRAGVIHRDIKPENILLHDGRPVVADFGIALAVSAAGGGRMTETGLSLGTPHYMSPEQASADRDLSARSDVYSLGCVLYEMIGGQPPHTGPSAQSILVHILTKDATPLSEFRRTVPPHVEATVTKAIEKLPADRFETARQFLDALGNEDFAYAARPVGPGTPAIGPGAPPSGRTWSRDRRLAGALIVALAAVAAWGWLRPEPPRPVSRYSLHLSQTEGLADTNGGARIAVSPAGDAFVYASRGDGPLVLRRRAQLAPTPLQGTQGASTPFFSPDGRRVGFQTSGGIEVVSLAGGPPVPVTASRVSPYGLSWGVDGYIYADGPRPGGLVRVRATGGEIEPVTSLDAERGESDHGWPEALPNGRGLLFTVTRGNPATGDRFIAVHDLETGAHDVLFPGVMARYAASGHLLYVTPDGTLMAAPFDQDRLEAGEPEAIATGVRVGWIGSTDLSISREGTLVYTMGVGVTGLGFGLRRLVVVDREGNEEPLPLAPRDIGIVGWSPDGESVVYSSAPEVGAERQIFMNDVARTTPRQLTYEGSNLNPVFSPDGTRVAFDSSREGTEGRDLFVKSLVDDSPARSIVTLEGDQWMSQWPSDSLLVFRGPGGIWTVDISDEDDPRTSLYLGSEGRLSGAIVSPDGRLAAYRSDESGQSEIYVRGFPVAGAPTRVSEGGGDVPFWSPDGETLYYVADQGAVSHFWAARMERDPVPVVLSTEELFSRAVDDAGPFAGSALHPDGDRWILATDVRGGGLDAGGIEPQQLIVVENVFEELRSRGGN